LRLLLRLVLQVVQMEGEGGVAGALHGSLHAGALATTFTCSQVGEACSAQHMHVNY
jgi:pyruvate/2-oxoacid:ferredoxin oxidoreductase alpha subunit